MQFVAKRYILQQKCPKKRTGICLSKAIMQCNTALETDRQMGHTIVPIADVIV